MIKTIKIKNLIGIITLLILAFFMIYPIIFLIVGSIMGDSELRANLSPLFLSTPTYIKWSLLPLYPTLVHYVELLLDSPEYYVMFWNSFKIVAGILFGQLVIGMPCAWGFARFQFKGKKFLFFLYIALMLLPFQVLMLSEYIVLDSLNLIDTLWSIILPGAFSTFPVFIMYHYFATLPKEIMEAAKLDGASELKLFIDFGLPLGRPGILSALVLGFLEFWNLIEQPITFLETQKKWPLSMYLPNITTKNAGVAFAISVVTLLPPLIVFLIGERYLEEGIAVTGSKES